MLLTGCQQFEEGKAAEDVVVPEPEPVVAEEAVPVPAPDAPEPSPARPPPPIEPPVEIAEPEAPVEFVEREPLPEAVVEAPAAEEAATEASRGVVIEAPDEDQSEVAGAPPPTAAPEPPAAVAAVPQFPWPPPRASAMTVVPAAFVRPDDVAEPTLGDVAGQIRSALDTGGYFERSYFAAPGGFAMVTRLERINPDGTPKADEAERWAVDARPIRSFSLGDYLRALFTAPSGHYRIIVFVVSSQPFAQSGESIGRSEAIAWLSEGLNTLPHSIAQRAYTDRHTVTALIYEFEQPGHEEALLVLPGNLVGRVHLERAMVWDAFRR